jgi:hypothetical protein
MSILHLKKLSFSTFAICKLSCLMPQLKKADLPIETMEGKFNAVIEVQF